MAPGMEMVNKTQLTESQPVPRKLPLMVIRKLGRVNIDVVVAMDSLNDFPLNLVFRFL